MLAGAFAGIAVCISLERHLEYGLMATSGAHGDVSCGSDEGMT